MNLNQKLSRSEILLAFGFLLFFSVLCVVDVVFSHIAWVRPVVLVGVPVLLAGFINAWVVFGRRGVAERYQDDDPFG